MGWVARNFDASVTWKDVEWVRSLWDGPLVIKGIALSPYIRDSKDNELDWERRFEERRTARG